MGWESSYYAANLRCNSVKDKKYHIYGGRGIKFLMTKNDFKYLWERDKAWNLKCPTIDRVNSDGNYELNNCRFIEKSENTRRALRKITDEKVLLIKKIYAETKISLRKMEPMFGIKKTQLCNIVNGKTR